ncbi:MAG: YciI family protein [Albidovulum sp.]
MQYMLLIYGAPEAEPQYGTPAFGDMMAGYAAFSKRLVEDGAMRGGEGLKGIETATSLRVRAGKVETMDGPFATTKEHLGGYYVIEVPDLDAALKYAAMIPTASYGTVEVRPLMDYNPAGN